MIAHPQFRRAFWRGIQDLVNGPFQSTNVAPVVSGNDSTLRANGVLLSAGITNNLLNWMAGRRAFATQELATVRPAFAFLTTNNTVSLTNNFTLIGVAPIEVKDLKLNGNAVTVLWTSVTNWSFTTTLSLGLNTFTAVGYDRKGNALPTRDIGDYEDTVTVIYVPLP